MIYYKLRCDQFNDEDIGRYISFGIDIMENGNVIRSVKDITNDKQKLSQLIELCNSLQLSPMHLDDVIEDFLLF